MGKSRKSVKKLTADSHLQNVHLWYQSWIYRTELDTIPSRMDCVQFWNKCGSFNAVASFSVRQVFSRQTLTSFFSFRCLDHSWVNSWDGGPNGWLRGHIRRSHSCTLESNGHVRLISSYSHSAEKCLPQSCLCNALLVAKQPMNHRRPHQILPQSDPCASPAEIMNRFHKIHPRYSHCEMGNWDLWRSNGPSTRLGDFKFRVGNYPKCTEPSGLCIFACFFSGIKAMSNFTCRQFRAITAMPSHSHEPHDSDDMSYDTHVHPIHPHWKPNKFVHLPFGNNIFSDSRHSRLFSTRRLTPWAPDKLVANRAEGTQH